MNIKITFTTKHNLKKDIIPKQSIIYANVSGYVEQFENEFVIDLCGDSRDEIIIVARKIWEICFLYDGYFYMPKEICVDDVLEDSKNIIYMDYYITDKKWIDVATTLGGSNKKFTKTILNNYDSFRNKDRGSKNLINALYYLHSENYCNINTNHILSMLLNICDGFAINLFGDNGNIKSNITRIIKHSSIDKDKIKYAFKFIGLPEDDFYVALAEERNEIDHYIIKDKSLSSQLVEFDDVRKGYVLWYYIYLLSLVLRVSMLKIIIEKYSENDKVDYALNNIIDWFIIGINLDIDCFNPINRMKQIFKK